MYLGYGISAAGQLREGKRVAEDILAGITNGEHPPPEDEPLRIPHGTCAEGHQVSHLPHLLHYFTF